MKLWIGAALILLGILLRIAGLHTVPILDFGCLYVDIICIVAGVIRIVTGLRQKKQ